MMAISYLKVFEQVNVVCIKGTGEIEEHQSYRTACCCCFSKCEYIFSNTYKSIIGTSISFVGKL